MAGKMAKKTKNYTYMITYFPAKTGKSKTEIIKAPSIKIARNMAKKKAYKGTLYSALYF